MEGQFTVKAGEFEGPIEVLLRLIEEKKLHASQVSLAAVADDFIGYMQKLDGPSTSLRVNKSEVANFIYVASTLMLIKSLSLLPTLQVTPEEKESIEDLERRLKLYQRVKDLSVHVKERFGRNVIFLRETSKTITPVFAPTAEVTTPGILASLKNLLANFPKPELTPQVIIKKVISLEEAIESLTRRVQTALRTSFRRAMGDQKEKVNIIVGFLGLLELVKRGIVSVEQGEHFSDIQIETSQTDIPRYT
jgi:segregation and condensation protein A